MNVLEILPEDWRGGSFVGRVDFGAGPTPVLLRNGRLEDMSAVSPTVAELLGSCPDGLPRGRDCGDAAAFDFAPIWAPRQDGPSLLAPVDLHCIKAAGVTFAASTLERVIEERARGDGRTADALRHELEDRIGGRLQEVVPGSEHATALKTTLIAQGMWSQYLEVAIGNDAEIFTKAPTLSAVGWGAHVGVRDDSNWNNPEPEVVLVCAPDGRICGATLGNDVNLRDFEGRSALLLGKAKDNNASCAIGPFIRLFDGAFDLDRVRQAEVVLDIEGTDGFRLHGASNMRQISRDPEALVAQTVGAHHRYPDGFALFLGTMFVPAQDRDAPGAGFTHKPGDRVRIRSADIGVLENEVTTCDRAAPWEFGIAALMRNLAGRGLLTPLAADQTR
jgi:fumarylacetoacetate (FAA) hydrolase family protein